METLALLAAVLAAVITAALFAFVAFSVYLVIVHRRYAHIPQPKGASFFLGHMMILEREKKKGNHMIEVAYDWSLEYGPLFLFWGVHVPILIVCDPADVKALSTREIPKPSSKQTESIFGQRFIKRSLATLESYDEWKERRRVFNPAFTQSYLRGLVPIYNSVVVKDLIDPLRAKADGTTSVAMKTEFSRISLQVISEVAFGSDFERDPFVQNIAGKEGLTSLLRIAFDGAQKAGFIPFQQYMPFLGRDCTNAIRKIRAIGRHCIELRMKALDKKENLPMDIMSQILSIVHIEKNVDIEDLVDEFLLFYLAGQETTSTLLSFTTGLLIQHPDILHRVMEEIEEVVGDKTTVEADDLDQLTYMHQVLEEANRLYGAGGANKQTPPAGITLSGYHVPGGTMLSCFSYCSHRNPEHFTDPLKFDPDRFGPGQKRPSPYVYYPFGIGHRSCIGRVFAMMEAKVAMVHLLRTFTLSLPEDYCLKLDCKSVMVEPVDQLPCVLTLR